MQSQVVLGQTDITPRPPVRLHYLDWLRVLAIFGVFLFHAVHPFDISSDWTIKNAELSEAVTVFLGLLFPWGMPFFFLIAGAGSWFALRRRTAGQFATERLQRLLIPFVVGCVLLSPIMLYFQWRNVALRDLWHGPFWQYVLLHRAGLSPRWFGEIGYHLWFLAFLFCFSLLSLPIFLWLKGKSGQALVSRLGGMCARRGGILLFILPLLLVRLGLKPFFPLEQDWADFFYLMTMFVLGFVLYAHKGFTRAIRRDGPILVVMVIVSTVAWAWLALSDESLDLWASPRTVRDFLLWTVITINSWCWTTLMLFIGMRYLDFSNKWLEYGQEAVLPFFLLHQPVIVAIAFYVVQWQVGIPVKLLTVVLGSFVASIALYELVIRRIGPLRILFGMKAAAKPLTVQPQESIPAGRSGTQPSA
jgi:peptidoglycan/LPS O-acetylase OafA/YrhL